MKFRSIVERGGKTATGIPVPDHVVAALNRGKRPPVIVTIGGYRYLTTIGVMGGRSLIPLSAEHRSGAGVTAGDEVEIDIALDDTGGESPVPADLAASLDRSPAAAAFFSSLTPSQRREWSRWITDAKRDTTRRQRVDAATEALQAGRKRH